MAIDGAYRNAEAREIFQSISDEDRRQARESLSASTLAALCNAPAHERASYLTDEVLGKEEIWVAFENDALTGWEDSKTGALLTPVWPHAEFVRLLPLAVEYDWEPVPIPITDWIDMVTPDLVKENCSIALFPVEGDEFDICGPLEFIDDWEIKWKYFAKHWAHFGKSRE